MTLYIIHDISIYIERDIYYTHGIRMYRHMPYSTHAHVTIVRLII